MSNVGKSAIAVILILLLAFAFVTAFSMAKHDTTTSDVQLSTINSSQTSADTVVSGMSLMFTPMVAIIGIIFLFVVFIFLRKH